MSSSTTDSKTNVTKNSNTDVTTDSSKDVTKDSNTNLKADSNTDVTTDSNTDLKADSSKDKDCNIDCVSYMKLDVDLDQENVKQVLLRLQPLGPLHTEALPMAEKSCSREACATTVFELIHEMPGLYFMFSPKLAKLIFEHVNRTC